MIGVVALMGIAQDGWRGLASVLPWLVTGVFVLLLLFSAQRFRRVGWLCFATPLLLLAGWGWVWAAGSFHNWTNIAWDVAALCLAVFLAERVKIVVVRRRVERYGVAAEEWATLVETILLVAFAWLLLSAATFLRTRPLPVDPGRLGRLDPVVSSMEDDVDTWKDLRIGLALSGGGFRAAVFHAGVLQALEDIGVQIDNLATVSGGSIVGGYYAVGGDPEDFADAVAAGRFDLKRQLMVIHHAVPLMLPGRLPGSSVELLPVGDFDRLDVQRRLLQRLLFSKSSLGGGLSDEEPRFGQPHLMIAVTDLAYGFQLGLLPDGLLKLGEGRSGWDVYRAEAVQIEPDLSLAERIAISGAFPVAFPPRTVRVKVDPIEATGRAWRELLLVDGGVRDNLGHHLLRAADALAAPADVDPRVEAHRMPAHWDLDAILVSDGGAVLGVLDRQEGGVGVLGRLFDVADLDLEFPPAPESECELRLTHPPTFSPARLLLRPDQQFNLKNDSNRAASVEREWTLQFDPARYPEDILSHLVELVVGLPEGEPVNAALVDYLREWKKHRTAGLPWARSLARARQTDACLGPDGLRGPTPAGQPSLLPGVCEALVLKARLQAALEADLEVFRSTSTLDDRLPPKVVVALERLGQVLVYLQWPVMTRSFETASRCRGGSDDPPGSPSQAGAPPGP